MSEIMLHDAARAHDLRFVILRYFNVAGADPQGRTGQSTPAATHLIKVAVRSRARQATENVSLRHRLSDAGRAPASATTSMSAIWRARIRPRSVICAAGAPARLSIAAMAAAIRCLEVIDAVRRVSGRDFARRDRRRRPGDPAGAGRQRRPGIRATLPWQPRFQDLDTIVAHAFAWERKLNGKRAHAAA